MDRLGLERTVKRYYDSNTPTFVRWEKKRLESERHPLPIHRKIWAPGVKTVAQALDWVHLRLSAEMDGVRNLVDLGCGNGAALYRLKALHDPNLRSFGLTLSPYQASQAESALGGQSEFGPGTEIRVGSYLDATSYPQLEGKTLYYAVESVVHATSSGEFCSVLSAQAKPGDRFALCDDFLNRPPADAYERSILTAFREGWKAFDLQSPAFWEETMAASGWKILENEDWSPWVDRGGWLRRLGSLLVLPWKVASPAVSNLRGGGALVLGYPKGLFTYRFMVWERV